MLTKLQFRQCESVWLKHNICTAWAGHTMAASSADDIPTQLAALLGRDAAQIRKTDDTPPLVSVIDVAVMITGKSAKTVARDLGALKDRYPEVSQNLRDLKFPGRRQRDTPVTDAKAWGLVQNALLGSSPGGSNPALEA